MSPWKDRGLFFALGCIFIMFNGPELVKFLFGHVTNIFFPEPEEVGIFKKFLFFINPFDGR